MMDMKNYYTGFQSSWQNTVQLGAIAALMGGGAIVFLHSLTPSLPFSAANAAIENTQTTSAFDAIKTLNLFGSQTDGSISTTQTGDLELKGVLVSVNDPLTGAYLAQAGQDEVFYPQGAALPGGGVLKTVFADHVVIRFSGRETVLAFKKDSAS